MAACAHGGRSVPLQPENWPFAGERWGGFLKQYSKKGGKKRGWCECNLRWLFNGNAMNWSCGYLRLIF